jgi:pyruvate/2-oxoglutarate dehydrogenase complex dihydrolipoamide dehydrogenase (E3) component
VILGGGTGSTIAAWTFAGEGKRVAVVERKYIGGSCPNIACLPSKNIIPSAKVASYFRRSKEFGITLDGFAIDMADVRERKRRMVRGLNDMYMENYRNTGAEFILGTGRFLAPRTVEVTLTDGTTRQLRGANVIVSTGTRAALDAIPSLAEEPMFFLGFRKYSTYVLNLVPTNALVGVARQQIFRQRSNEKGRNPGFRPWITKWLRGSDLN